jgi:SAM-dependent methyltransferase
LKLPVLPAKLETMGRFASAVEFYSRYREPYPPAFFNNVAELVGLRGNENLLDIGCGPGLLAIGFAPFVEHCTGIDPEAAMIAAARTAAAEAGVSLTLIHARIEEFSSARAFDFITIGRALHWMDRTAALPVLEQIVSHRGRILICRAAGVESPSSPWMKPYNDARLRWGAVKDEKQYWHEYEAWFAGSCFSELATTSRLPKAGRSPLQTWSVARSQSRTPHLQYSGNGGRRSKQRSLRYSSHSRSTESYKNKLSPVRRFSVDSSAEYHRGRICFVRRQRVSVARESRRYEAGGRVLRGNERRREACPLSAR